MVRSGPFWDHVTEMGDGLYCKFCNHKFAPSSSISRIKSHLSGVEGLGVKICTGVPGDVKEAACLAIHNKNKRRKTMASSSQNDLRNTGSTFSTEQANGTEIPIPTVDVESMQTEVMSMEFGMETIDFQLVEAADPVENMSLEFMQPVGTSSSHERLLVDAPNNIREDAFPTTDLVSQVTQQDRQPLCNDDLPGNSRDISQSLGVTPFPDFEEFESRASVSNQIVAALKDPNVDKVGVYGMGGTGKTTLVEKIGADLHLNGTFSYVVLATVSEKQSQLQNNYQSDLSSIQKQIAGGLKVHLEGENLRDRAAELREQLQKRDKVLIILDDLWSRFELKDVGIPVGSCVHTKFKILMTSRNNLLLQNQMDSTKTFELCSLPFADAWNLFDKMVGRDAQYSNWRPIAEQVVEQCGGIPILLATTARALRNANRSIWEDALTQLKQFDGEDFDEDAYKRIEVSYNFLKNEEIKKLFLLCTQLNHRSIEFDELLRYAMGLDLFKERKTVKEVSGRLQKYLRELKGCCLLQDGNKEGIIRMHDVVHKFASFVAFRDHDVFSVAADGELEEWPSKDQFEKFTAISFFYCRLPSYHELPVAFDNPKLESFLMLRSRIDASFKIPDNFFAGMKGLKLMDLGRMSLSPALPSSLSALEKLRTLYLDGCELGDIAVIGELQMLQALSLVGSSIVCVPKEIGKLGSTLKLLDLRYCRKLIKIASGVISRLTLLEDLRIGDSFTRWEQLQRSSSNSVSADETYEAEMASLEEFKNLPNLINLEIDIREHAKMFPKDLVFKKLETFRIFIGSREWFESGCIFLPRTLVVFDCSIVVEFDNEGTKALMTRAESLLLEGVKSSVSVIELDPKGFPELKHLSVGSVDGIQYIVKKNYNNCIFPKLETLDLSWLDELERVFDDHDHPLPVGSFENLRVINVSKCDLLNDLFSSNLARGLLRLKEIRVEECARMESIIVSRESENEEEIKIGFTDELRVLELEGVPRLLSFCRFKQLEGDHKSATPLFNKKIVFPKLKELRLKEIKVEKIWDDENVISVGRFQNLTSLKVSSCRNLLSLAPPSTTLFKNLTRLVVQRCPMLIKLVTFSSTAKSLVNLKEMSVRKCGSLEEIVVIDDQWDELASNDEYIVFDKLEVIALRDLNSLTSFCSTSNCNFRFPSLNRVIVENCPKMKFFSKGVLSTPELIRVWPCVVEELEKIEESEALWKGDLNSTIQQLFKEDITFNRKRYKMIVFPKLKELSLHRIKAEMIWDDESAISGGRFQNLTSLHVSYCSNLLSLAPPSTTLFKNLTSLVVEECPMLTKLITSSSTAKSLVNLKLMSVKRCSFLKEIVAIDHQCNDEYIVFENLEVLKLQNLNSLISFCSTSDCNFWFPSLNRVIVENCPKLKFFSKGAFSTPKLIRESEAPWKGDFNSTIQQLFEENITYNNCWKRYETAQEMDKEDEDEDEDEDEYKDEQSGQLIEIGGSIMLTCAKHQMEEEEEEEDEEEDWDEDDTSQQKPQGSEIRLTGLELTELPTVEDWEVSTLIHLNNSQLLKLPENPICPILKDLSLKGNSKLRTIPPLFFDRMPALRILDLSRTRTKSLPDSLFSLTKLKRLFLRHCNLLMKLSPKVGQLKGLQVLDLEGTEIMHLPGEVKELKKLKCLKVSFCELPSYRRVEEPDVLMISPGTLSALPLLEELSINASPDDGRWNECVEPVVSEVSGLAWLYKLQFYFPSMEFLSHFQWFRFKAFKLTAGHLAAKRLMPRLPSDAEAELERYDKSFTSVHGDFESEMNNPVLQHADALFLDRHTTMKTLSVFGLDSFKHLRCCVVGECNELQVLFCVGQKPPHVSLEYLYLYYMKSLRHIWEGCLPPMVHLRSLTLRTCPMLSSIFSEDLIGSLNSLKSLQEIIIDDCPAIINLVRCNGFECTSSSGTAHNNFLPSLKRISLHYLPQLNDIFDLSRSRDLEWMSIYHCANLKSLPIDTSSNENLKKIMGERSWWESLEWQDTKQHSWDYVFVEQELCY